MSRHSKDSKIKVPGLGFVPTGNQIVELLQEKERNHGYDHPRIKEIQLYGYNPQQLYDDQGIDSGNALRWFFTRSEDGNRVSRQTPNRQSWTMEGHSQDIGDGSEAKERSFYYTVQNRRLWHMKEHKLQGLTNGLPPQWALCCVYKMGDISH